MRDIVSCFTEHAIKVSDTSCSGSSTQVPSIKSAVNCLYKTKLSTQKQLLITITWCKNPMGQGLNISVGDDPSLVCKIDMNSRQFWKKKGSRLFESGETKIEVFWDLSTARFESSPEPVGGFYVAVVADCSELSLLLGDMAKEEAFKKFNTKTQIADFFLVARKEHLLGKTLYSTKARFCEGGADHDILIKCREENGVMKDPELCVSIDEKKVIQVKRLRWKFRGNQTIFIDGLPVDMLWDVHDWFFTPGCGYGVFMFRRRSGLESRLWLEEKMHQKEQEKVVFSLLIYAFRNS